MFLVTINCKPGWRLPDINNYDPTSETDPQLLAVCFIANCLTHAVASAVYQVDRKEALTPRQVLVNFGELHGAAFNAADLQILINPGAGDINAPTHLQRRCVSIHDYVRAALVELVDDHDQYVWPKFDIEIVPTNMSGSNTAPNGEMCASWGGVEREPRPFIEPPTLLDVGLDTTC